jgi:acylaminoacyl-peptidase
MLERFVRSGARVAKLDYTGSTGYGKRFQTGLTKKVGVADVDDVRETIDDLTDEFETSDVFLVGNSYGGYLALKTLVEEPRLIDGVAAIAAVTDWDELIGGNSSSIFAPYFGGTPNSLTHRYYRAAEIMDNLDEIPDRTPIVIAYGERDTTVPPTQSKIFIAGAENDKNLTKVVFPDEDHIPRKRATLDRLCSEIAEAFDLSERECSR